jgi:hypothetical protein
MTTRLPLSTLVAMHVEVEKLFAKWDAMPKPWSAEQFQMRFDMIDTRSYLRSYVNFALAGESIEIVNTDVKTTGE